MSKSMMKSFDFLLKIPNDIQESHVFTYTKENCKNFNHNKKSACKILKISSEFRYEEVLKIITNLKAEKCPNLFFFIVPTFGQKRKINGDQIIMGTTELQTVLSKFSKNRPIILQLTSNIKNFTKIFYKDENSEIFRTADLEEIYEEISNFSSFLSYVMNKTDNNYTDFESKRTEHFSIIIRLLRLLDLDQKLYNNLITTCAKEGSIDELFAAIDIPFVKKTNNPELKEHLCKFYQSLGTSILHIAIQNKNEAIINYLISKCSHLIQELPFDHQVQVSTTAFSNGQLDILCDLLEISDFPFPENFNKNQIEHQRLKSITSKRIKFEEAIIAGSKSKLGKFIEDNRNLRIVYSTSNKSALQQTIDSKKYNLIYYLKSFGFNASEFSTIQDVLHGDELKKAEKFESKQRRKNVKESLKDDEEKINNLCNRSLIHDRKTRKKDELLYRKKIRQWFRDLYKIEWCKKLLDVVAQCEAIKIIFDFESNSVENASLDSGNASGSMYPISKLIFVGAKLEDKEREQKIKGVLAHEMCHYAMKLIYENNENPYYGYNEELRKVFDDIVKAIDKWPEPEQEDPDDECNGIISSVYRLYQEKDFHQELIVRVVQILAQFDGDEEKLKRLETLYKILFEYFRDNVLPEMEKFDLKLREDIRKINRYINIFPGISQLKLEQPDPKDVSSFIGCKISIVQTNFPKLLLISIHDYIKVYYNDLVDVKNIFISPEKLKNPAIIKDYKSILSQVKDLNVFVDFSSGNDDNLKKIVVNKDINFVFIVKSTEMSKNLTQKLTEYNLNQTNFTFNYSWSDLSPDRKQELLNRKINFQNDPEVSFLDLFKNDKDLNENETVNDISEIVDEELLNLLLNSSEISVNTAAKGEEFDEFFNNRFQNRKIKKKQTKQNFDKNEPYFYETIMQNDLVLLKYQEFFQNSEFSKYILFSDIAGSGKSWAMKKFTQLLRNHYVTYWVTYVDLKSFINELKTFDNTSNFYDFITKKILKLKKNYEQKTFKKLYEIGKVFVLFDGFDEIAPNYAKNVLELAKKFESNRGNQLWIATRDDFEVDLITELNINVLCKFDELNEEEGVQMIVTNWVLNDIKNTYESLSDITYEKDIKGSKNFNAYQKLAKVLVKKITILNLRSIGLPLLYKMIAEITNDDKETALNLIEHELFKQFAIFLHRRWSRSKGQIRERASDLSICEVLKFLTLHDYSAIKYLLHETFNKFVVNSGFLIGILFVISRCKYLWKLLPT